MLPVYAASRLVKSLVIHFPIEVYTLSGSRPLNTENSCTGRAQP